MDFQLWKLRRHFADNIRRVAQFVAQRRNDGFMIALFHQIMECFGQFVFARRQRADRVIQMIGAPFAIFFVVHI